MNIRALCRMLRPDGLAKQVIDIFKEILEILNVCLGLFVKLPMSILEYFGIQFIPNLAQNIGCPLCTVCLCGTFLGITASLAVGLGVGLGVGLSCSNSVSAANATTNLTNTTINSINGTRTFATLGF